MNYKYKNIDLLTPTVGSALNKARRGWWKVLPGGGSGLVFQDLLRTYNLNITGWNDSAVSGWRKFRGRPGQFGYARFDGVDDSAAGLVGPIMTNSYTVAATIFIESTSVKGCIIRAGDPYQGFGVGIGSNTFDNPGNDLIGLIEQFRWQTLKTAVGTGWHRIAVAITTSGITAYLNGVQVYTDTAGAPGTAPATMNIYVGGYSSLAASTTTPRYFQGGIDNATLYSSVLSSANLREDYKQEVLGFPNLLNWQPRRRAYLFLAPTEAPIVRSPIGITATASWNVHTKVGSTYTSSWHDRAPVRLASGSSWGIRTNVSINTVNSWAVRATVGLPRLAVWGDRQPAGLVVSALWGNRVPVGIAGSGAWDVLTASRIAGDALWHVRARVGGEYSTLWSNRALAGLERSAVWALRGRAGLAGLTTWDVRTLQARWPVGLAGALGWANRDRVGFSEGATWDIRDLVTYNGTIIFSVFAPSQPGGILYDPAAAAAYLEARHGPGMWGVIPAAGSVRIDHDYPAPDALRATRGAGADGIPGVVIRIFGMDDYQSGLRQDPRDVRGRSVTGPDGRWLDSIYLIPGEYVILYEEAARFPVADYLVVIGPVPGREPPDLTPVDISNPYYELDRRLSLAHGGGPWGPGQLRGPSPVDHNFTGTDRYQFTRNGVGFPGVIIEIFPEADYQAVRTGDRYRAGWSRTNAAGRWDWPVNLYPGRYVAVAWHLGIATLFDIEVS